MAKSKKQILEIHIDTGNFVKWQDIQQLQPDNLKINRNHRAIADSMKLHGVQKPFDVWVDSEGIMWSLDGVGRKETLLSGHFEGWDIPEMMPVVFHECEDRKEAIAILSNVFSQKEAQVDEVVFGEWLEIEDIDMGSDMILGDMDFGFVEEEESEQLEAKEDEYEAPEKLKTNIVKGDIFEFTKGELKHRLMCGDSTDSDSVLALMDGEKADIAFLDPPHNDMEFYEVYDSLKGVPTFYMTQDKDMVEFLSDRKADFEGFFIYDFHFGIQANNQPFLSHFLVAKMRGAKSLFQNNNEGIKSVFRYGLMRGYAIKKLGHNQAKSLPFMSALLSCHKGVNIYDPFLGSGTTMVAAHQLKRNCFGMELDEVYCEVIVNRMLSLDAEIKLTLNGKDVTKEYRSKL